MAHLASDEHHQHRDEHNGCAEGEHDFEEFDKRAQPAARMGLPPRVREEHVVTPRRRGRGKRGSRQSAKRSKDERQEECAGCHKGHAGADAEAGRRLDNANGSKDEAHNAHRKSSHHRRHNASPTEPDGALPRQHIHAERAAHDECNACESKHANRH